MSENSTKKSRCIDVVFCIDGTGSMGDCIGYVKENAVQFQSMLLEELARMDSDIEEARVKIIVFRDYGYDGEISMQISEFFTLGQDDAEYANYLTNVRATGGGDGPENGFEALYYAMQSKFNGGENDRQVIVLFTDADALDLGARSSAEGYPTDMVDFTTLTSMWYGRDQERTLYLDQTTKRLVIFAPEGTKYQTKLDKAWDLTWYHPVAGGKGLKDISFEEIVKLVAKSASAKSHK